MDLCLISRFFDLRNEGIGRYSSILLDSLKNQNINVKLISQDSNFFPGNTYLNYLEFLTLSIPFKTPQSNIYHALSPLEVINFNRKNTIVTIHDLLPLELGNIFGKKLFQMAIKKTINCDKVIAISQKTAEEYSNYLNYDIDEIHIIRQSISPKFQPIASNNEDYTIGTISNLNSRKRVDILIKSFLEADIPNSKLFIAGKGIEEENLLKLAKNDSRIKFLGFIEDEKVNDFYNSLDVFVFPTIAEGYGLPMVEAMACEKPVVTLEDAKIPEEIKNLTTISKKDDLADILKNKDFKSNIKEGLNFAKLHSIDNTSMEMMKIYEEIASK